MNVERVGDVVYSDYRHIIGVEEEQVPTHLNTNDMGPYLAVSADNLSVKYIGQGGWGHDVGSLQANCPVPIRKLLYYFEMYVENRGRRGTVSIGFTHQHFHKNGQPGWESNTFGYHGDDGRMFHDSGFGMPFGPTYTTGDTVGAGINNASQDVFFTKNGEFIGSITKDYEGALFPTVGLHSPDERVVVNFGQQEFVFDIQPPMGKVFLLSATSIGRMLTLGGTSMAIICHTFKYLQSKFYRKLLTLLHLNGIGVHTPSSTQGSTTNWHQVKQRS